MDILGLEHRSALMSRVRGKNTGIEIAVRKALHARSFRYRLGGAGLAGRPDIVLPRHHAVVFVHGCFWHGHDCPLFRLPRTRPEFWRAKFEANRIRDSRNEASLLAAGWRVAVVWECALRGRASGVESAANRLAAWLTSTAPSLTIRG
jgi:DNA mismatch endonuclease, patch repair protein